MAIFGNVGTNIDATSDPQVESTSTTWVESNAYFATPVTAGQTVRYRLDVTSGIHFIFGVSPQNTYQTDRASLRSDSFGVYYYSHSGGNMELQTGGVWVATVQSSAGSIAGDYVELEFDYDTMTIEFFRNGSSLGVFDMDDTYGVAPFTGDAYFFLSIYSTGDVFNASAVTEYVLQSSVLNIDEVALFSTVLTAQNVTDLYSHVSGALSPGVSVEQFYSTGSYVTLLDSNRIAQIDSTGFGNGFAYINVPINEGHKAYVEFVVTQIDSSILRFGIAPDKESQIPVDYDGAFAYEPTVAGEKVRMWTFGSSTGLQSILATSNIAINDVIGLAFDYDAMTMDVTLNDVAVGSTLDLTNYPFTLNPYTGSVYFYVNASGAWTAFLRSAAADLTGTLPSGYSALEDLVYPADYGVAETPAITAVISASQTRPDDYCYATIRRPYVVASGPISETTGDQYFATSGFTMTNGSTPSAQEVPGTLKNPSNLSRELNIEDFGVIRATVGEVTILNIDGRHDSLVESNLTGRTMRLYRGKKGDTFPSQFTEILVSTVGGVKYDLKTIKLKQQDTMSYLDDIVLSSTFGGTGGMDGSSAVAGQLKQWQTIGDLRLMKPQLADASKLLYLISARTNTQFPNSSDWQTAKANYRAYDGGVTITRAGDYASTREVENLEPAPGTVKFYFGPDSVWMRLGSSPVYDLRVDTYGAGNDFIGTLFGSIDGIPSNQGTILAPMLVDDTTMTIAQFLAEQAKSRFFNVWADKTNTLKAEIFRQDPTQWSGTESYTFNENIIDSITFTRILPARKVTINGGQVWPGTTAAGANDEIKDIMERTESLYTISADIPGVLTLDKFSKTKTINFKPDSFDPDTVSASDLLNQYAGLYGVDTYSTPSGEYNSSRVIVEMTVRSNFDADILALDINDLVRVNLNRYGMQSGGSNYRTMFTIIGIRQDYGTSRITFKLWG